MKFQKLERIQRVCKMWISCAKWKFTFAFQWFSKDFIIKFYGQLSVCLFAGLNSPFQYNGLVQMVTKYKKKNGIELQLVKQPTLKKFSKIISTGNRSVYKTFDRFNLLLVLVFVIHSTTNEKKKITNDIDRKHVFHHFKCQSVISINETVFSIIGLRKI